MAFDYANLSAATYCNGWTMWHYKTPDHAAFVAREPGYFNEAASLVRPGDFIFVNADIDDGVRSGVLVVAENSGGHVKVADMTGFGLSTVLQGDAA